MSDYGHDLLFGSFITPSASGAQQAVELAVTSDRSGLDLVTFQDHPYQASFLDTSTLLAYVAARTENVHISANVTSLPLRPPAVLARAAASLDILSGGRFELGIGAGAFWEGIAAMGGRSLTAAQGVEALREAITVIRDLWDTDTRGGVRHHGQYYQVNGAKRGPRPAHDIAVWVGAYKPRMLALTGSVGDGWLPSMEYLPRGVESLPEMNARIDEAAEGAGRSPSDVRRLMNFMNVQFSPASGGLLNGPAEAWAEQIAALALEHGLSAFIIGGDDRATIERFGAEVAPAARDMVARERGR
ncbi:5,10-methylene tetrahydromethanopterin reductase [Streptomyces sp. AS58]|uniref:LLM class flavin-dependent oxidoreductase n=1 Tax=Streptomyces cadmiisoli TaxID=2184053 RepID=A0A2Z4ITU9_9ACTN|nr:MULTISPECIES: LLM class flavin-dependent oxidoreductase [Streptomyces]AWW35966.1 LLM class flavin-dependent oxidoreductase [Streptomyces cadmiisoli]KOV69935.1 5,10-methylene tetrahydromethanopterin reductase [Streptomyces sp. AS58]